jgi:hypothetical protein
MSSTSISSHLLLTAFHKQALASSLNTPSHVQYIIFYKSDKIALKFGISSVSIPSNRSNFTGPVGQICTQVMGFMKFGLHISCMVNDDKDMATGKRCMHCGYMPLSY